MKAIVLEDYGEPDVLRIREVADPSPGPEEILVDVHATALNRADLLQRRGLYPPPPPKPAHEIPGLEFAGEVAAAGERVTRFRAGDRVMGVLTGGGYAERVTTHERLAAPIPDGLDWTEAAALPEAFTTAVDALAQCGLRSGESVLVHAAGSGVGIAAIQVASVMGARPIFGTAGSDRKLQRAAELGLDIGIPYKERDFAPEVLKHTDGAGVDVIVDFVGASYLARNIEALALCGRLVVIGLLGGLQAELDLGRLLTKRLRVIGTVLRSRPLEEKAAATRLFETSVLPHVAAGKIRPVVDRVFPFSEIAEAHRYMETNANFGKIVIEIR